MTQTIYKITMEHRDTGEVGYVTESGAVVRDARYLHSFTNRRHAYSAYNQLKALCDGKRWMAQITTEAVVDSAEAAARIGKNQRLV